VGRQHLHAAAHGQRARSRRAAHRRRWSQHTAARARRRDRRLRADLSAGAAREADRRVTIRRGRLPSLWRHLLSRFVHRRGRGRAGRERRSAGDAAVDDRVLEHDPPGLRVARRRHLAGRADPRVAGERRLDVRDVEPLPSRRSRRGRDRDSHHAGRPWLHGDAEVLDVASVREVRARRHGTHRSVERRRGSARHCVPRRCGRQARGRRDQSRRCAALGRLQRREPQRRAGGGADVATRVGCLRIARLIRSIRRPRVADAGALGCDADLDAGPVAPRRSPLPISRRGSPRPRTPARRVPRSVRRGTSRTARVHGAAGNRPASAPRSRPIRLRP